MPSESFVLRSEWPRHVPLTHESGVPELFREAINHVWQTLPDAEILSVLVSNRVHSEWAQTGDHLTNTLLKRAGGFAIFADGQCSADAFYGLISDVSGEPGRGSACLSLSWDNTAVPRRYINNSTFRLLSSRTDELPLDKLWDSLDSNMFNYGFDLIALFTRKNLTIPNSSSCELTEHDISDMLLISIGWIIPLDENIGFIIGIRGGLNMVDFLV